MLPSPAEISPRAPRRRPARIMPSIASVEGVHGRHPTVRAPRPVVASDASASRTIGRCPTSRSPSRTPEPPTEPLAEPLSQNRDFKVLLVSQGISALGDAVSFTALPLLVLALTGSGFAMGVVGALQTLPILLFGLVAGAIADRSDRKRMMFLADLGRGGLTALIPISVSLGGPTMAVILLVAAPISILRSFFLAGYTASVPTLVGRSQVGDANAFFEAIYSIGFIVGPAIAGILADDDRPGPDAGDRRRSRSGSRRSACSSSGATCRHRPTGRARP